MEKINIAELLKDCPKGMELDCAIYEDVYFDGIDEVCDIIKCYIQEPKHKIGISFNKYGHYSNTNKSKCVIFPKGKTTWEGFQRPFRDGDIVVGKNCACSYITIFREFINNTSFSHHVCLTSFGKINVDDISDNANLRFATDEEKQKLFDAIKAKGYHWNTETKTLEKLVEPKFKVGDRVRNKNYKDYIYTIHDIVDKGYSAKEIDADYPIIILFGSQEDNYELVPNKFDITTLKPFESKVLVRDINSGYWIGAFYSHYNSKKFYTIGGSRYYQCIPYEGNEHLLDTTNDCDDFYKTWE